MPHLLNISDPEVHKIIEDLLSCCKNAVNQPLYQLLDNINTKVYPMIKDNILEGLKKIILERCELTSNHQEISAKRWQMILKMQEFINQCDEFDSFEKIKQKYIKYLKDSNIDFLEDIYEDIDVFQKIKSFIAPHNIEEIIHRYNCAQIQGLLWFANKLILKIKFSSVLEQRIFLNLLKFNKLLLNILNTTANYITLEISGPLAIFNHNKMYGIRLANFFPHILKLNKWKLEADILLKNKNYKLVLDDSVGIKSHYKDYVRYYPEEITEFVKEFNKYTKEWKIDIENPNTIINLGDGVFCVPDMIIVNTKVPTSMYFLEFFHSWHKSQLNLRIKQIQKNTICKNFILCIDSSIINKELELNKIIKSNIKFIKFNTLPNIKTMISMLE